MVALAVVCRPERRGLTVGVALTWSCLFFVSPSIKGLLPLALIAFPEFPSRYARLRKTFGKRLLDHQVIRHKLADMIRQVEATHSQLENLTYQLTAGQSGDLLGGQIALVKVPSFQSFLSQPPNSSLSLPVARKQNFRTLSPSLTTRPLRPKLSTYHKVQCTQVMEYCAREALQIFGGNGVLKIGHGEKVERIYRDVRISAIGGGSEEILRDLAIRQARL